MLIRFLDDNGNDVTGNILKNVFAVLFLIMSLYTALNFDLTGWKLYLVSFLPLFGYFFNYTFRVLLVYLPTIIGSLLTLFLGDGNYIYYSITTVFIQLLTLFTYYNELVTVYESSYEKGVIDGQEFLIINAAQATANEMKKIQKKDGE